MAAKIYHLKDITDMSEQEFTNALQRIDKDRLLKSPDEAVDEAGIHLKEGFKLKLIHHPEDANNLPDKVIPVLYAMNNVLSISNLQSVSGGVQTIERIKA